ncbi:TPA: glycosyltransferase family 8 protein, partial [Campylobacter jejuni]|nr:hypothetical protein [Campylobacter jejuni]
MNKSMYNVVICPDVNYLKYASVLITNIVLNINIAKSYSLAYHGLHFHILCNNFSKEDLKKLASMECDLGRIYPIKITTHVIKNIKFKYYSLPHWINSFAAYYRLIAANFVDQNIEKFLYLDVDTYVNSDIRELFEKSLNGKVLSAMIDINTKTSGVMGSVYRKAKIKGLSDFKFIFPKLNFNTGVLLIDLIQWKKQKIEERCFDFLEKYETFVCDQDSLCAIIGDNFTSLGLEWNFFMGNFLRDENNLHTFKETHQNPMWNYTRKEYLDMKNNIRIVHFTSYALKSWDYYDGYLKNNPDAKFYYL